jgi:hypothetical protein
MAFTSSQTKQPFAATQLNEIDVQDLIHVRQLYLERRYKQCIAKCQDLIKLDVSHYRSIHGLIAKGVQLHGVHCAFLQFHEAISYEALGQAAHAYSRNKLHFLELAKEKFTNTLDSLPQPFDSSKGGGEATPRPSPIFVGPPTETDAGPRDSPESVITPTIEVFNHTRKASDESEYSTSNSSVSETYTVPDFNKYSPRPDLLAPTRTIPRTVTFPDVAKMDETDDSEDSEDASQQDSLDAPSPEHIRHKARLSACLSSTHVLANDLVPSPLFSRTKKTAHVPFPPGLGQLNANTDTITPEVTDQPPRPLPRTPFTHTDHTTLLPSRRTAVQTLITKYENKLPSPNTPSSYTTASVPPSSAFTPRVQAIPEKTPTTARFANIASIFAPNKADRLAEKVNASLSSHAMARYNSCLADFRTCLHTSISRIEEMIDQAHETHERRLQEKREQDAISATPEPKGMGQTRLRSFWLLKDPLPSPVPEVPMARDTRYDLQDLDRGRRIWRGYPLRPDDGRARFNPNWGREPVWDPSTSTKKNFPGRLPPWNDELEKVKALPMSVPTPLSQQQGRATVVRNSSPQVDDAVTTPEQLTTRLRDRLPILRTEEDDERRQQRIAKLRAANFEVRKEDHGWKGGRHYDDLARRVERSLG